MTIDRVGVRAGVSSSELDRRRGLADTTIKLGLARLKGEEREGLAKIADEAGFKLELTPVATTLATNGPDYTKRVLRWAVIDALKVS